MEILIIGGGDTAQAFKNQPGMCHNIDIITKQQLDIRDPKNCQIIANKCLDYDAIIVTAGVYEADACDIWSTNVLGPVLILNYLVEYQFTGHVIVMSSHAANWTSWPDIPLQRLNYNCSKQAISTFVSSLSIRSHVPTFTIIEPPSFQSRMSQYKGIPISTVVDAINQSLESRVDKIVLGRQNNT